jgi:hypothetical protein
MGIALKTNSKTGRRGGLLTGPFTRNVGLVSQCLRLASATGNGTREPIARSR